MKKNNYPIKECFDLTTKEGVKSSLGFIAAGPFVMIGAYLLKSIFGSNRTEVQTEMAENLIKRGKEDGVDEMEITMDNSRGFKFKAPIEGVDIETKLGADEKMHVKVKYK